MILSGWGRFPQMDCQVARPRSEDGVRNLAMRAKSIARGNGRAYGDAAMNAASTIDMRAFNRLLAFDDVTGRLTAEAGVLLADVIDVFLPRGWFPAVTPGTKFVTVGGMIAADVHGKNHHKDGSFRSFVDWIDVMDSSGTVRRCSRDENADMFEWTLGGMGLTGIVLRAGFRLRPVDTAWISQRTLPAENIDVAMELFEQHQDATYSVAWIDCLSRGAQLGRSILMFGEHATLDELPPDKKGSPFSTPSKRTLSVPFNAPSGLLNRLSVRAFNALYFRKGATKPPHEIIDWDSYFYPLDAIRDWNRIYGRKGFAQFQCVLPLETSKQGMRALLEEISGQGAGSFLAVLKRFGPEESRFSFPMAGYTLALDFPISRKVLRLLQRLDLIVIENGGRFYLAKDSRMSPETLAASDPRSSEFAAYRHHSGEVMKFSSAMSERLRL